MGSGKPSSTGSVLEDMPARTFAPTDRPTRDRRGTASARTVRARRATAVQDRALYRCACGHASTQAVSTTVACPACGSLQDW